MQNKKDWRDIWSLPFNIYAHHKPVKRFSLFCQHCICLIIIKINISVNVSFKCILVLIKCLAGQLLDM